MANVVLQREVSQRSPLTTDAEIAFEIEDDLGREGQRHCPRRRVW